MWSTTYLYLLLFIGYISSVPINTPIQRTFTYHAENQVFNDAAPDHVARWDIHAKLIYQTLPEYSIIKLDKVSVSIFNGILKDHEKVETTDLPPEAKVLTEPFIFYYNNTIGIREDEPNWSFNMKKSIASILYINIDDIDSKDFNDKEKIVSEDNMYGSCNVTYKMKEDDGKIVLDKIIDIDECGGEIQSYWSANKVVECSGLEHEQFYRKATRRYVFSGKDFSNVQNKQIDSIHTRSIITFHVTPNDKHKIQYKQTQHFSKLGYGEVKDRMDVTKMTLNKKLRFEHGEKPMDGRLLEEQTSKKLSKTFYDSLLDLKNEITKPTSTNSWEIEGSVLDVWENMDEQTLSSYNEIMEEIKDDQVLKDIVLYILPYVGNNNTLKYIEKLITANQIEMYPMFRMISLLPYYINSYDENIVENMKFLLDLPTENKLVRNSGILGYSQIIYKAYKAEAITKDKFDEIVKKFLNSYKTSKDYESRMVYLLGLHNMNANLDILLPIIEDTNESHHLRLIAIDSAIDELREDGDKIKDIFIPMLKNDSLVFELRVAALSVLIGTHMYEEDYDIIYEYLKDESGDLAHKHLYNYFYSTLSSYIADTKCTNDLAEVSKLYLSKLEPPHSMDVFLTGHYRLAFSNNGPDYGLTTEVKTISDPIAKSIDLIQLTFDSFKLGLQTKQKYHLKLHGIMDKFIEKLIKSRNFDKTFVKEFIDIVKEHGLTLPKQNDLHIEFIIYENDKAVFATHYDLNYLRNRKIKTMLSELIDVMLGDHTYVTFPVMDYLHLPSDLGTDLTLGIEEELVGYDDSKNIDHLLELEDIEYTLKHRSLKSIMKSMDVYNPINYVKLGAVSSVIENMYGEIKFHLDSDVDDIFIEFNNNDLIYDSQFEIVRSTHVDNKTALQLHCKDCKSNFRLQNDGSETYDKYFEKTIMGLQLINTINGTEPDGDEKFIKALEKSFETTIGNFEVFPMSFFWYVYQNYNYHQYYTPNWNTLTERTQIIPNKKNPLKTQLKYYVDYDDEMGDHEVVPGSSGIFSLATYLKTVKDDKQLEYVNVSVGFHDSPGLYNQSYHIGVDYNEGNEYSKVCFDLDMKYPELDEDLYSIKPAKPTKAKFMVMYDLDSKPISKCDEDSMLTLQLDGLFSVMKEQEKILMDQENSPLKQCIKDSKGLKYTAPTEACQKASEEMSTYRKYDINGVVSMNHKIRNMFKDNDMNEVEPMFDYLKMEKEKISGNLNFTIELLNSKFKGYYMDDDSLEEIDDSFIKLFSPSHRQTYIEDELLVTSKDFVENMEDFEYGLTSTCHVTSSFVNTFADETVNDYKHRVNDDIIGMVDCETGLNGFAFSVLENKLLTTVVWTDGYKINVKPQGKTLLVTINDEVLEKNSIFRDTNTLFSNPFQVYYEADDVLVIKSSMMHLYYNTEYIRVETYSSYINKMCGICSKEKNLITV